MEILQAMRVKLIEGEQILRAKRPKSIDSALKAYEAQEYVLRFTPEANNMARKMAKELIDTEPGWGEAYYILSEVHMMDVWLGMTKSPKESLDKAIVLSEKAVSLDDSLSKAFAHIGYLYALKREYDKSIAYAKEAVEKDPNGADAHAWLGNCLRFVSRVQEAITHYEKAMRLNPHPPQWYYINLGVGYTQMGRYEEAVAQIKKALASRPNSVSAYSALVVTYGIMGKEEEARTAAEELLRINPNFSAEKYIKVLPYKDPEYPRKAGEALRKAGLK
jgi:tetratricopeptide (TPR) repeat protein